MSRLSRFSFVALVLGLVSTGLGACQSLAGIDDRTFDPVEGGSMMASDQCKQYCTLIKSVCVDPNLVYLDDPSCLATCALLPQSAEPANENSVGCRLNQLTLAQRTAGETDELPAYCAKAGPGGSGTCGSNCESYCQLYAAACQAEQPQLGDTQYDQKTCVAKCAGLADTGTFDVHANYSGDTLQCRLAHITSASVDPKTHCPHAQLQAQGQALPDPGPCTDPDTQIPDCDSYCKLEMAECDKAHATYESLEQCQAVCQALPPGKTSDIKENTVGCRKYHSYNALVDPDTHCPHTGPGGDGHCGDMATGNCESYCILLANGCAKGKPGLPAAASFEGNFEDQAACQSACAKLAGTDHDSGYAVSPAPTGDNVQCRLFHVSRALTTPSSVADECPLALGGADCSK